MRKIILLTQIFIFSFYLNCWASVKEAEFGGQFYPGTKAELSTMVDNYLLIAQPKNVSGSIFLLLSPHAGFGYSGATAAYGYKLIKNKPYKTVIILGASHHKLFNGAAVYGPGEFKTSLGVLKIDEEFTEKLVGKNPDIFIDESVFLGEHSVEVQLPFLQSVLHDFKIVPVVIGDCSLDTCNKIASIFEEVIGSRRDVLIVVSTDLYHGYDILEVNKVDALTLGLIKKMDYEGLYYSLRDAQAQACGGMAAVIGLNIAKETGADKVEVLNQTTSALVTGETANGQWTVGYGSVVAYNTKGEDMLNNQQKKKLLKIARASINTYLQTGKKMQLSETDAGLTQEMGAFVTLNKHAQLKGCIGNLTASQPLYLTIRDMAAEAAVSDPRFTPLTLAELKDIEIEISVLSPLKKVDSADKIELGKDGVLVRKGYQSGVFLPQVATETGWSKEEFLNNLCAQKAGLPADAWKDKSTELYIFKAEVFSEEKGK
ncbi:MAG: AmmeMemoRadiSam system protein B [Candidatus Omnitrophica bacterium]|nr:AmmeMemoRadiSam system protein B [Candidatus Omnitrophota bacterium]